MWMPVTSVESVSSTNVKCFLDRYSTRICMLEPHRTGAEQFWHKRPHCLWLERYFTAIPCVGSPLHPLAYNYILMFFIYHLHPYTFMDTSISVFTFANARHAATILPMSRHGLFFLESAPALLQLARLRGAA